MGGRQERGGEIARGRGQITRVGGSHYRVRSQSRNILHDVTGTGAGRSCSCEDYRLGKARCKHIRAVEIRLSSERRDGKAVTLGPVEAGGTCKYCGSGNVVRKGIRRNKNRQVQKYRCRDCSRGFSTDPGFDGMCATPETVTQAMQLYFTGESLRGVQRFLKLQGASFSHIAIHKWVKKYVGLMDEYLATMTPRVGDRWHADEVWLKVRGDRKYLFAMMDNETRFWLAHEVADSKFKHNAESLLRMGKKAAGKTPSVLVTDGLPAYRDAFRKTYAPRNFLHKDSRHIREIHLRNQAANNNIQERLNGEFRDREKAFRGLKRADSPAVAGIQIHHNYIRPHMGLGGDTPADRAGIEIEGTDKWKTVIQNAAVRRGSAGVPEVNTEKIRTAGNE